MDVPYEPDLLALLRGHDLPPSWDGNPVCWGQWRVTERPLCPAASHDPCAQCGSTANTLHADGSIGGLRVLTAIRCAGCKLDTVWDHDTDEWWTLDHTDYDDSGSNHPDAPKGIQRQ